MDRKPEPSIAEPLTAGRMAMEEGDWDAAAAAFEAARAAGAEADGLDGLAQARWFQCRLEEALDLRERAFAEYCASERPADAARAALWLAIEVVNVRGTPAVASGWRRRAERLLDGLPCSPAHVELEIARARSGDPEAAEAHFARAMEYARELGSPEAEIRVQATLGLHRVANGDEAGGMALLDEAMIAVLARQVRDPWAAGGACCQLLSACDQAADWRRATEWYGEIGSLVEGRNMVPLWAWCRSTYGGILLATGDWERAESELLESLRIYGGPDRPMAVGPLARLAELRMRQGRHEEAERLIEGYEDHPEVVATAVAVLLARGKPRAAANLAERHLARLGDASGAGRLLPLLVDARLALGDAGSARDASRRLLDLARRLGRRDLVAAAEAAVARVALAEDDARSATAHLDTALELYDRLGMPLEAGRARLGLARALAAAGDAEPAVEEGRRALRAFERLGARPDADAAAGLLRELGASGRSGVRLGAELTARELEVLGLLAEGCSNARIAERLVISPKTAEHHVSRILSKLGLSSRAEAAAHAVRAGISSTAARSS